MYIESLEKVRMNIYIKKKEKEKFIEGIVRLANGSDVFYNNCFIVTKDMEKIDSEQRKIADRVDRWMEIKDSIIPETSSFNIWRRVKSFLVLEVSTYFTLPQNQKVFWSVWRHMISLRIAYFLPLLISIPACRILCWCTKAIPSSGNTS